MEERLVELLLNLPHSYSSFVKGIMGYAKKKPKRMETVLNYLENNKNLTCSDVVYFVSIQPDFREDSVVQQIKVG